MGDHEQVIGARWVLYLMGGVLFVGLIVFLLIAIVHLGHCMTHTSALLTRRGRDTVKEYLTEMRSISGMEEPLTPSSSLGGKTCRDEVRRACIWCKFTSCIMLTALPILFLVVLIVSPIVAYLQVSRYQQSDSYHDPHVTPPDFPRYMGCVSCNAGLNKTNNDIEQCVGPCTSLDFVLQWESFARSHPWKLVYFPSRKIPGDDSPVVNVSAWWLPADTSDTSRFPKGYVAPRIVVQHGLASNNNHCGVQSTCFLLRTMGFSCLTPTVRDYGISGNSTHHSIMTWGYDYPYDVLGAWDYAVNDPDGVMGGKLPERQVGLMGFSRGALDVAIAMGLDERINAGWIDSAPYSGLYGMVGAYVKPFLGPFSPVLQWPVWKCANLFSQYMGGFKVGPVDYYDPLELLTNCSGHFRRHVHITHDMKDSTVPTDESKRAIELLSGLSSCWTVLAYTPPAKCNGETHHQEMWIFPDDTRKRLCSFWSAAFRHSPSRCGLQKLPKFQQVLAKDQINN